MSANPLRAEFVVTGAATIVAAYLLASAIGWDAVPKDPTGGEAAILIALLIAGSSIVGAVVVQLTFDLLGRGLRSRAAKRHVDGLLCLGGNEKLTDEPALALLTDYARRHVLPPPVAPSQPAPPIGDELATGNDDDDRRSCKCTSHDEDGRLRRLLIGKGGGTKCALCAVFDVITSLALDRCSADAGREIDYRRSNRQIFLGVIPAAWLAAAAGAVAASPDGVVEIVAAAGAAAAVAAVAHVALYRGAMYQEARGQAVIIDAVLLQRPASA